jgi:hypothetical protein
MPGGRLWLTAPLFYEEHEQPFDFYRYTQFGFRHQLESAGFQVESIEWLEGYAGTVSYQFKEAAMNLPWRPGSYGGGLLGVITAGLVAFLRAPLMAAAALLSSADVRHRFRDAGQCKNYAVVAVKVPPQTGAES